MQQNRPITVIAPRQAANLIRSLKEQGAVSYDGILGMIRLLNPRNVLFKVKKYTRALGYDGIILEQRDDRIYLGYREQIYSTDSSSDLIRLLFGPQKPSEIHPFEGEVKKVFDEIFPLPIWVWGWDSV
jgi:hypothetical protein